MKRMIGVAFLVVTMLAIVAVSAFADEASDRARINFILENWGASRETVQAFEGRPPLSVSGNIYHYRITFLGSQANAMYLFSGSSLIAASISLVDEPTKLDQLVPTFDRWKAFVSALLGQPTSDISDAKATDQTGRTVSWEWETGQSLVVLSLNPSASAAKVLLSAFDTRPVPTKTASSPASSTPGSSQDTTDFRRARWGMTKDQVLKTEATSPLIDDTDSKGQNFVIYTGPVGGLNGIDVTYGFVFKNSVLVGGLYMCSEKHSNPNLYIEDFKRWKSMLANKYGIPTSDEQRWLGGRNLYENDPNEWGWAVSMGYLEFVTSWETDRSFIYLILKGDNSDINLTIGYVPRPHVEQQVEQSPEVNDLI